MKNAFQLILKVLQEELGLVILGDESDDFPICDYIPDSITFVQFIISIEEKIGINLTDDFLDFELLSSAKGFSEKLDCYMASFHGNKEQNESITVVLRS